MDGDTQGRDAVQRGRPTDYKPEFCQKAADLCINGATDFEVAEILGVCVRTLYRWKAQYPEFCQALKVGKAAADDRVEASLFHRAVGYSHPAVKIFMPAGAKEPVFASYTEHVPPDVGAATLWLTNRRGDEWRSKQSLDHTSGGKPLAAPMFSISFADGGPGMAITNGIAPSDSTAEE